MVQAGWRLKLDLNELLEGGDAKRPEREAKKAKKAREDAKRNRRYKGKNSQTSRPIGKDDGYAADGDDLGMAANDPWGIGATYGGSSSNSGGKRDKWYKDTMGDWTVTMDIKVGTGEEGEGNPIPREGLSLLHTALVHSEETKGGRTKLKPTEGEAVVNSDGGVGQLGTFGDVTKAAIRPGIWHRVVVAVKCATSSGSKVS